MVSYSRHHDNNATILARAGECSITVEQAPSHDNNNDNNAGGVLGQRGGWREERDSIRPYRLGVSLVPDGLSPCDSPKVA